MKRQWLLAVLLALLVPASALAQGTYGPGPFDNMTQRVGAAAGGFAAQVEGVVAEGAAASTADPLVGGVEARAFGALPAVLAGQAARLRGTLVGSLYATLTDAGGTVTPVGAPGSAIGGVLQTAVWDGAASRRTLGLASGLALVGIADETGTAFSGANPLDIAGPVTQSGNWSVRTQDGAGNALTSAAAGALRPLHTLSLDAAGAVVGSAANPQRVDPTGTTAQPASQSGVWSVRSQDGAGNLITSVAAGATRPWHILPVDANGVVLFSVANPGVVSGTVTANQGGAPWTVDTELPAAVVLSDALPNPTVPGVGSYLLGWNNTGGTWDRLRSINARLAIDFDLVGGAQVSADQGLSDAGTIRVVETQPGTWSDGGVVLAVDQTDTITYAIPATAAYTQCQNQSTRVVKVRGGANTAGGTLGATMGAGGAADDGTAGLFDTHLRDITLYFYDDTGGGGSATVYCYSELQ